MMQRRVKDVNFFKPRGAAMRSETRLIMLVLMGWLLAVFCSQGFALIMVDPAKVQSHAEPIFFNLPITFWLTAQFLPLWFIILCVAFNFWMDSHTSRDPDSSMRFRVRPVREGEE